MNRLLLPAFLLPAALSLIWLTPAEAEQPSVQKVEYTSSALRDPFLNPFRVREIKQPEQVPVIEYDLSHLQVQGLIWDSPLPQAIINNTIVEKGTSIEGAEIIDIFKDGVYVLYQGQQYLLVPTIPKKQEGR